MGILLPSFGSFVFSRMRSDVARVPVSLWGSGGKAVFAKCCVCVRNRPQPSATVRNVCVRAVRLSLCANATGVVSKVSQVDS